jgi:hypothetical protein
MIIKFIINSIEIQQIKIKKIIKLKLHLKSFKFSLENQ